MRKRGGSLFREMKTGKSVFMRIFLLMTALLVVLAVCMLGWTNHIAQNNNRRILMENEIARLELINNNAEQIMEDTAQMMTQMIGSNDFLSFAMKADDSDETRDYRIVRQLMNASSGSGNIITELYFGSFINGEMYGSVNYNRKELQYSEIYQLIDRMVTRDEAPMILRNDEEGYHIRTYLINSGGRLFIAQYFSISAVQESILFGEMDIAALMSAVSDAASGDQEPVYIYDVDGTPVLGAVMDYTGMQDLWEERSGWITRDDIQENKGLTDSSCYYLASDVLGWQYLMQVDTGNLKVRLADTAAVGIPIVLVVLLLVIVVVYYAVRTIYQPINELLETVVPESGGKKRGQGGPVDQFEALAGAYSEAKDREEALEGAYSEVKSREEALAGAYSEAKNREKALAGAYSEARNREEALQATIASMAPAVLETTLRKIAGGQTYTEEQLFEILDGIGNPVTLTGRFVICTCMIEKPDNRLVTEREWNLYLVSLQNLLREADRKDYTRYVLRMEHSVMAVLMVFPEDVSAVSIKRTCLDLCSYLIRSAEPLPYQLWAEYGKICSSLTDIHESYLESVEKIQYRKYAEDSENPNSGTESEAPENVFDSVPDRKTAAMDMGYIRDRVREMVEVALKGDRDRAMAVQHRLLDEIEKMDPDPAQRRKLYKIYLDELMEKVIVYPLSAEEQQRIAGANSAEIRIDAADDETLGDFMEQRGIALCDLFGIYGRKNQYKYVDQAKAFIEGNYTNSDLALNNVSEHIGISASYLSELFNEVSGMKFSAYLAEYRVEKARQLLQATTLTIREIGFQCGFNSVQNFIRVFKKVSGYTPGQYREIRNGRTE